VSVDRLQRYFEASASVKSDFIAQSATAAVEAGQEIRDALLAGRKLLVCGNGGSAADAQHLCAEVVCRFETKRRAFPAIALSANVSSLTAWSNDYDFETVFSRQVEAFGEEGDVLVAISTSGNSANVVAAVKTAAERGLHTIGLLGKDGGKLKSIVDRPIVVPAERTAHVQECHLMVYHYWCEMLDS
jgi:D-sedoheptulose 7-phosphate isomerase